MEDTTNLPLTVLIADDHRLFRQGLIGLLGTRPDLVQVVGEAATGREAITMTRSLRPALALMDIAMPDGTGLDALQTIRERMPETAVVMLTASDENEHLRRAMRLGAAGYLLKDLDAQELFKLIAGVAQGEAAITRAMAARMLQDLAQDREEPAPESTLLGDLTEREIDVLRLVAQGVSNPEIAEELYITVNTVKTHLRNILDKLHVENRTQAATYAVQKGLITPFDE